MTNPIEKVPFTLKDDNVNTHAPHMSKNWAYSIIDKDTGEELEYRHLIKREKYKEKAERSFENELGRLAQGVGGHEKGTNTIFFIPHKKFPETRQKDVTYGRICVNWRPQKAEPLRTRLTVGGNLIDFPGDVGTPTADITTAKYSSTALSQLTTPNLSPSTSRTST